MQDDNVDCCCCSCLLSAGLSAGDSLVSLAAVVTVRVVCLDSGVDVGVDIDTVLAPSTTLNAFEVGVGVVVAFCSEVDNDDDDDGVLVVIGLSANIVVGIQRD